MLPRPCLLALDIDGTILDGGGILRPSVRRSIAAVAASGVDVILATGRSPWGGIAQLAAELHLPGVHITMQGALISEPATGRVVRLRALSPGVYLETLRFAAELGLDPIVGLLDGQRAERVADSVDFLAARRVETRSFRHDPNLDRLAGAPPVRVFMPTGPERHRAVRMAALARLGDRAAVVWSDSSGIEILARGTNKGEAVAWLAATRGIDLDAVAAVGDAPNDTEMLRVVGRSAAMGVAPAGVRAAADIVVPTSDEDGVVEALAWFFPDLVDDLAPARPCRGAIRPVA